jgi:hypothetical protein
MSRASPCCGLRFLTRGQYVRFVAAGRSALPGGIPLIFAVVVRTVCAYSYSARRRFNVVKDQVLLSGDASADNNAICVCRETTMREHSRNLVPRMAGKCEGKCRQPEKDGSHWRRFR